MSQPKSTPLPAAAQPRLLLSILLVGFLGQMLLNPLLAPLSRQLGLAEWQVGATISLAALALAACSPFWGWACGRWGVKPVLVVGLFGAALALAAFALVSLLGMRHALGGPPLVVGVVVTRGLLYGAAIASLQPAVQSHLVTHTNTEQERVAAVGAVGAVMGLAAIVGGVLGGALAGIGGLALPLVVMPVLVAGALALLTRFRPGDAKQVERPAARRVSYRDPRVFGYLLAGLPLMAAFATLQTIFGFLVQDRFGLSDAATASVTAAYLAALAITLAAVQTGLAPRLGWAAPRLLRAGAVLSLVGVACLLPGRSYLLAALGVLLLGAGFGLAMPAYNAGPTLQLDSSEQGALAGLISANNGVTYALAPLCSTALYGWWPAAALVLAGALLAACLLVALLHPQLRQGGRAATESAWSRPR